MKFPVAMLREFVETSLSAEEIGDLLTMAGFELEGIEEVEGDSVLDIKVVSNRGDGLSVFGLSREVLAKDLSAKATDLYRRVVAGCLLGDESSSDASNQSSVDIQTADCTRYAGRIFRGTSNSASPEWLQKRLRQAGLRPLGKLVDLSNYVMLELGQPLHAFDLDTLDERRIVVRGAKPDEKLTTLNGVEHELCPHHMMICDAKQPVAVAGVMGGSDTEVGEETRNVLLESAHFVNTSVRRTRKELGLNTDASYRFERSVDPNGVVRALNRFAELLADIEGTESRVPGVFDNFPSPPSSHAISVRVSRAEQLLGMPIGADACRQYLERLGFQVSGDGEPFSVEAPSWRPDIVREEDLIEEIGRIHGYDRIPTLPPSGSTPIGGLHGEHLDIEFAKQSLLRSGFVQTISHSLGDRHPLDSPSLEAIGPRQPSSPEMAWLRTSLLSNLAQNCVRNGSKSIHLFEIGRVHGKRNGEIVEERRISMLSTGALQPDHWRKNTPASADFFSLKSAVESCAAAMGRSVEFVPDSGDRRLHPTRQARLDLDGRSMGVIGQIHPTVAEQSSLPPDTFLAVIDLEALLTCVKQDLNLRSISRNPAVRRDISLLIDQSVPYFEIEKSIVAACGDTLERVWLSDVYTGQNLPEGKHSLTLSLQLRKHGENFTDEEANSMRDRVVKALESLGGSQR